MKKWYFNLAIVFSVMAISSEAQQKHILSSEEYNQLKRDGKLPADKQIIIKSGHSEANFSGTAKTTNPNLPHVTSASGCGCYIPPDGDYQIALPQDDDNSSDLMILPFKFCFYGEEHDSIYINNNGNVSFETSYGTFSSTGFPFNGFKMVAPFWSDVDTRCFGGMETVFYKMTSTALYVNWEEVGYYDSHCDLISTFQLIMTDGTDPVLPNGNNVAFCYRDMQWTTGDASSGVGGFGGVPATVGVNKGDGATFIQVGRFDSPGNGYISNDDLHSGIDWLDNKSFIFNTCTNENIPPMMAGLDICDTILACVGDTLDLKLSFLSPEIGQTTSADTVPSASGLSDYTIINSTPGNIAEMTVRIIPTMNEMGPHTIAFKATDDGVPVQSSVFNFVIKVDSMMLPAPVITGLDEYCEGGSGVALTIDPGTSVYDSLVWNTGVNDSLTLSNLSSGVYSVMGYYHGCKKRSLLDTVIMNQNPEPVITGVLRTCDNDSAILKTTLPYTTYAWSNGTSASNIYVSNGIYTVFVVDSNGCVGTSPAVTITSGVKPNAVYTTTPSDTSKPVTDIKFNDLSTITSGNIVSWHWDFGDTTTSTDPSPTHQYTDPGSYKVCLIIQTQEGCMDTMCSDYFILPQTVLVPNIFTPNDDEYNQHLKFTNLEYHPNSRLRIYNRWGNKMFESANYKNDWDGNNTPDGVYYYILEVPKQDIVYGFVTIMR